jgi:hypothetical protein
MIVKTNLHLEYSLQEEQRRAMRSKVLVVAFLLIAPVIAAHAQSAPVVVSGDQRFHFTEKPGPDAVGLKVVEQYDFSRSYRSVTDELGKPYQGERARPLQTLIWYPAQKSSGKPMTVGDYGDLPGSVSAPQNGVMGHGGGYGDAPEGLPGTPWSLGWKRLQ